MRQQLDRITLGALTISACTAAAIAFGLAWPVSLIALIALAASWMVGSLIEVWRDIE